MSIRPKIWKNAGKSWRTSIYKSSVKKNKTKKINKEVKENRKKHRRNKVCFQPLADFFIKLIFDICFNSFSGLNEIIV